jgi:hypothetical protein
MLRNIADERKPHLHGGGILKPCILCCAAAVTGRCSFIAEQKPISDKLTKNQVFFNVSWEGDHQEHQWTEVAQHHVQLLMEMSKFWILVTRSLFCNVGI